jgi:hypothetical protein
MCQRNRRVFQPWRDMRLANRLPARLFNANVAKLESFATTRKSLVIGGFFVAYLMLQKNLGFATDSPAPVADSGMLGGRLIRRRVPTPLFGRRPTVSRCASRVGTAAGLTVLEGDLRSRFARWQALQRPGRWPHDARGRRDHSQRREHRQNDRRVRNVTEGRVPTMLG